MAYRLVNFFTLVDVDNKIIVSICVYALTYTTNYSLDCLSWTSYLDGILRRHSISA